MMLSKYVTFDPMVKILVQLSSPLFESRVQSRVLFLYYVGHAVLVIICMGLAETTNSWDRSDNSRVKRADRVLSPFLDPATLSFMLHQPPKFLSIYIYIYIYIVDIAAVIPLSHV